MIFYPCETFCLLSAFLFFFEPNFSDDSHQVVTPPAAEPMPLIAQNLSADQDQTIPNTNNSMDLFQHDNDVTLVKDDVTSSRQYTPNQQKHQSGIYNNGVETPKSALLKTHKRMSSTVLVKKEKRQMVGEESHAQLTKQQQQQHIDEGVEEERPSVCMPASELEASTLLDDIKERRVSAMGLTDTQVLSLAKLIATMTGTDENLVYQLISLLPKKEDYSTYSSSREQSSRSSNPGKHSTTHAEGQNTPMSNYTTSNSVSASTHNSMFRGSGSVQKVIPYQDRSGKPISSVIPINADRTYSQHQDAHRPPRDTNINYMQSTRIPDRYSDPQPLFERAPTEQRLAVSVSPVRNNARNNCVLTPSYASHYIPPCLLYTSPSPRDS